MANDTQAVAAASSYISTDTTGGSIPITHLPHTSTSQTSAAHTQEMQGGFSSDEDIYSAPRTNTIVPVEHASPQSSSTEGGLGRGYNYDYLLPK